jgi:hypothetical protein
VPASWECPSTDFPASSILRGLVVHDDRRQRAFLYCAVLTVQGFTALLLPRRIFLRLSAILQLGAFGLFLGVYFCSRHQNARGNGGPSKSAHPCVVAFLLVLCALQSAQWLITSRNWPGWRRAHGSAWAQSCIRRRLSLILCYLRTMKKNRRRARPGAASARLALDAALRQPSPIRNRALQLSLAHAQPPASRDLRVLSQLSSPSRSPCCARAIGAPAPPSLPGLSIFPPFMMMASPSSDSAASSRCPFRSPPIGSCAPHSFARRRSTLPQPDGRCCSRCRPVWLVAACPVALFQAVHQVVGHLAVLVLLDGFFAEISLIGFYKVPFHLLLLARKIEYSIHILGILDLRVYIRNSVCIA